MLKKYLSLFILITLLLIPFLVIPHQVKAAISSCGASVTPNRSRLARYVNFSFSINNTSSSNIAWIKITSPVETVTLQNTTASGWSISTNSVDTTLRGTLAAGGSLNVTVNTYISDALAGLVTWQVQASDDDSGAGAIACSGSLDLDLYVPDDEDPPSIGSLTISDITESSAKVTFQTNEDATSVFKYGISSSSENTLTNSTASMNHTFNITGLTANTTYLYKILATDGYENTTETEDNTFVTAKASTVVTVTTTTTIIVPTIVTKTVTSTTVITPTPLPKDTTPPSQFLDFDFKKSYPSSPVITGRASDGGEVRRVEYSIDNGKNWLAVAIAEPAKNLKFEFIPTIFDEGNYEVRIRAIDTEGNIGLSSKYTLVIDRLPPKIIEQVSAIGPQLLLPQKNGSITALTNLNQDIILSAVGGATSIDLFAENFATFDHSTPQSSQSANKLNIAKTGGSKTGNKTKASAENSIYVLSAQTTKHVFTLVKNNESGLWKGTLRFSKPGLYKIYARTRDGAGNETNQQLSSVAVGQAGRVVSAENKQPVKEAEVTLWYYEQNSSLWYVWDAASFKQLNPQKTSVTGEYSFIIPAGKYYLSILAQGFAPTASQIFETKKTEAITALLPLKKDAGLSIGSINLPRLFMLADSIPLKFSAPSLTAAEAELINKEAPPFILPSTEGGTLDSYKLRGKTNILTFISTWSPASQEQITIIEQLPDESRDQITVILLQESLARAKLFSSRGGYNIPFVVDQDGILVDEYKLDILPKHFIIDRKGIIKKIVAGVLNSRELSRLLVL